MGDEYEIEVSVDFPSDSDGFIRRECPHCLRQFKWHDGPANEEAERHPEAELYSCPLCGQSAEVDPWNTQEQVDLVEQMAMPQIMRHVNEDLDAMFRRMKGITYTRSADEYPDESVPLTEPDDMMIVASPCHGYEPVKVPEDHTGPLHCLVCGAPFTV